MNEVNRNRRRARTRIAWWTMPIAIAAAAGCAVVKRPSDRVNASATWIGQPAWDNSGKSVLALSEDPLRRQQAYVFSAQARKLKRVRLVKVPPGTCELQWAGPRQIVLWMCHRDRGGESVYREDPVTGQVALVGRGARPAASPDGERAAFIGADQALWIAGLRGSSLERVPGTGIGAGAEGQMVRSAAWSPESRAVALLRRPLQQPTWQVAVAELLPEGRIIVRPLLSAQDYYVTFGLGWLDAHTILLGRLGYVPGTRERPFSILAVPTNGEPPRQVLPPGLAPPPVGEAMWLRGGLVAYPTDLEGDRYAIVDLNTRRVRNFAIKNEVDIGTYSFSPGATYLAVITRDHRHLLLVDTQYGASSQLAVPAGGG